MGILLLLAVYSELFTYSTLYRHSNKSITFSLRLYKFLILIKIKRAMGFPWNYVTGSNYDGIPSINSHKLLFSYCIRDNSCNVTVYLSNKLTLVLDYFDRQIQSFVFHVHWCATSPHCELLLTCTFVSFIFFIFV